MRRTLLRTGGRWQLAEPKTPGSRRHINLPTRAVTALRRQKARQAEQRLLAADAWSDYGLIFTGPFGDPIDGPRITERRLRPILKAAGLKVIRFHDLRHTAATIMLEQGVHPKIVSELA